MRNYEAMFLFDPAFSTEWDKIREEVDRLMTRAEARVIVCEKWDERRLAYEIRGRKRGIYVLVYFEADPAKIGAFERDVQLAEAILRVLVTRADHLAEEDMKDAALASAKQASAESERPAGRGRRGEGSYSRRGEEGGRDSDSSSSGGGTATQERRRSGEDEDKGSSAEGN